MSKSVKSKTQDQSTTPFEGGKDVLEVDVEDLGVDGKIEVGEQLGKAIKQEIARFDPFEVKLNELKEKYSSLTIVDVEDKAGYEDCRIAIADLRSIRTGTAKDKAIIKAPFLAACKTIEDRAKWIIEEVEKIEDPLDKRKKEIDTERDAIKAAKKAQQERDFIARTLVLTKLGAEFNGVSFKLGEVEYDSVMVKESDQDVWETLILPKYQVIFDAAEVVRVAAEKEKADAAAELLLKQQEMAAKEAEMKQREETMRLQQEAIDKANREAAEKERIEKAQREEKLWRGRLDQLENIGWNGQEAFARHDESKIVATYENLIQWSDEEFNAVKNSYNKQVSDYLEKKRLEKEESDRQIELQRQKKAEEETAVAVAKALADEKERIRLENEAKLKAQQEAAIKKQQELDMATDKEKYNNLLDQLAAIKFPECKSATYRAKVGWIRDFMDGIKNN